MRKLIRMVTVPTSSTWSNCCTLSLEATFRRLRLRIHSNWTPQWQPPMRRLCRPEPRWIIRLPCPIRTQVNHQISSSRKCRWRPTDQLRRPPNHLRRPPVRPLRQWHRKMRHSVFRPSRHRIRSRVAPLRPRQYRRSLRRPPPPSRPTATIRCCLAAQHRPPRFFSNNCSHSSTTWTTLLPETLPQLPLPPQPPKPFCTLASTPAHLVRPTLPPLLPTVWQLSKAEPRYKLDLNFKLFNCCSHRPVRHLIFAIQSKSKNQVDLQPNDTLF